MSRPPRDAINRPFYPRPQASAGARSRLARARRDGMRDFDFDAWVVLLEEQRKIIARAAGVDPSRVKIRLGH